MSIVHKTKVSDVDDKLNFVMSDESVDYYDDQIMAKGWRIANFERNPICLFNHDKDFVVGKWMNVRVDGTKLKGRLQLAPAGSSPRIDEIRALVGAGILKACSVGFRVISSKPRGNNSGTTYEAQELVECSLVATPANPSALLEARRLGVSSEVIKMVFRQGAHLDNAQRIAKNRASVRRAKETLARTGFKKPTTLMIEASQEAKQKAADRMKKDQHNRESLRKAKALLARMKAQHELEAHPTKNPDSLFYVPPHPWDQPDPDARWRGVKVRQSAPDRFRAPRQGWNRDDDDK